MKTTRKPGRSLAVLALAAAAVLASRSCGSTVHNVPQLTEPKP